MIHGDILAVYLPRFAAGRWFTEWFYRDADVADLNDCSLRVSYFRSLDSAYRFLGGCVAAGAEVYDDDGRLVDPRAGALVSACSR